MLFPIPAFANAAALNAIEQVLETRMGSLPAIDSSHSYPAHGKPMTCRHYDVPGGTLEAIGAKPGLSNAGSLTLETTDAELVKALSDSLSTAIGPPKATRGQNSQVWDVKTSTSQFADQTNIILSSEGGTHTLRLERRKPIGDPLARAELRPAAPSLARNLDPVSNYAMPLQTLPSTGRRTKSRDD